MLRKLTKAPPWDGEASLVAEIQSATDEILLRKFRDHLEPRFDLLRSLIRMNSLCSTRCKRRLTFLVSKSPLGRLLGVDLAEALYGAVFAEYDGIPDDQAILEAGAPDLLLWFPNEIWFFSEVKGRGDYLSPEQYSWLNEPWDLVCGHYVLTILE